LALPLIGEGEAFYRGERLPSGEALKKAGLKPVALEAKEAVEAENKILAPKAGKWDQFMNSEGLIGMTAIADMLNLPVRDMTNWLVEEGVFRKQPSRFGANKNMPRRMYQSSGHFTVKLETNGKVAYEVAYATVLGADFVFDRRQGYAAA
jgi:DNA-damage-inducible protein D